MNLNYVRVDKKYKHSKELKRLFVHAFPLNERPPYKMLLSWKHNELYGIEDNDEFVGLVSLVGNEDLLYVFFLAIEEKRRGQGYGSQVLQDINNKYKDRRIFLMAEDPNVPCDNKTERDNRMRFYAHNGLFMSDVKVSEFDVEYVLLTNNTTVGKEDFLNLMKYLLGDYYSYYRKHIK